MKTLVILLLILAAYFNSVPLFFAVAVLTAANVAAGIWVRRVTDALQIRRRFEPRLFFGESTTVTIEVRNGSALPLPWLRLTEHRPAALILPSVTSQVLSLKGGQGGAMSYELTGKQRGFHPVGPLFLAVGDVFGLAQREVYQPERQYLIVYPRILSVQELGLPTLALFGDLRSRRRILGDPARVAGVRDYAPGDPLHDIHWRATAAVGTLQVKQYQPATTVHTMIFLDLHRAGYPTSTLLQATEFAVTVAATVASRLIEQRQEVGLVTNGTVRVLPQDDTFLGEIRAATPGTEQQLDALSVDAPPLLPARGQAQLMRLLELLARVDLQNNDLPLLRFVTQRSLNLPWGSTTVIITGTVSDALLMALHRLREAGLLVVLFSVDRQPNRAALEARARALGVLLHIVWQDHEVEAISS